MKSPSSPFVSAIQDVALPVLKAALPLLAKLRRPQLLLQERRLQAMASHGLMGGR
jgi:hypothetical protein